MGLRPSRHSLDPLCEDAADGSGPGAAYGRTDMAGRIVEYEADGSRLPCPLKWLDNFAFHVGYEWQMFVFPPVLLLVISLVTIIFVTLRSASTGPAVWLKAE